MKIEEYLKTSPIFLLLQAEQLIRQELQNVLRREQVNFLQALILIMILLEGRQAITPSQIVKALQCTKSHLSQMLAHLEAKGWLYRSLINEDARCHSIALTASGSAKANKLIKCMEHLDHKLETSVSTQTMLALTSHLRELASALLNSKLTAQDPGTIGKPQSTIGQENSCP